MKTLENRKSPFMPIVAPGLQFVLGCAIFACGTLIMMSELVGKLIAP